MRIAGIIAEYNPFHNGHRYHIEQTYKKTQADGIVCVMSGHFTQRGEPALADKWSRTTMALENGIDVVLELPAVFATGSAQYFARGGITLLQATGIIDYLSFGSETPRLELFQHIANILLQEPPAYKASLHNYLKKGISFPQARMQALSDYFRKTDHVSPVDIGYLLKQSNNILAIEYLQALQYLKSDILPIPIERIGAAYTEDMLKAHTSFASATAIRNQILQSNSVEYITPYVPGTTLAILKQQIKDGKGPISWENLSHALLVLLRQTNLHTLSQFPEMEIGLENRFSQAARQTTSLTDLLNEIKTKRYTYTRLQRILCYILLNLTKQKQETLIQAGPQYLRILGFSRKGQQIIRQMKRYAALPLLTTIGRHSFSNQSSVFSEMLQLDILTTDLYSLAFPDRTKRTGNRDYYEEVIRI